MKGERCGCVFKDGEMDRSWPPLTQATRRSSSFFFFQNFGQGESVRLCLV